MSVLGILGGLAYFTFRLVVTQPGANPPFFWLLFSAELFGFLTFLILVWDAWEIKPTPRLRQLDVPVDILITVYNEDIEIVEPTIIGALKIRGNTTIWLCDDGRNPEYKKLAKRYGIKYQVRDDNKHAKAGNINAVLPKLTGELVLVLDADHVPSPDFLEATSGYFADLKVALVQTAHSFRNHNSVMHDSQGRHEQSLFFDVLLPGRNRVKSVFWCGSAGLLRRSALVEIGGMATYTSTEDFETTLRLRIAGYEMRYHNEHIVQGLAPDNLEAYIVQRFRWAQGTLASYRKGYRLGWSRKLPLRERISYFGGLIYYVTPIQRAAFAISVWSVLFLGVIPVGYAGVWYLAFWGAWVAFSLLAVAALERGSTQPFEGVRNNMIALEAFYKAMPSLFTKKPLHFAVTPKNEVDLGGWRAIKLLRLPIAIGLVTVIGLIYRWSSIGAFDLWGWSWVPPVDPNALYIATGFALLETFILGNLAVKSFRRRQMRHLWRFPVDLTASADGHGAKCIDMHQAGAAFVIPKQALPKNKSMKISINCRSIEGEHKVAHGTLAIKNVGPFTKSGTMVRVGGKVEWKNNESREIAIEQCYVVEPHTARNQFWARRAPRVPVELAAKVGEATAICINLSIGGAAFAISNPAFQIGDELDVVLKLNNERSAIGVLEVRGISEYKDNLSRVGGIMTWQTEGWLADYTTLAMVPVRKSILEFGI
ncbi:glycosyltransferase family 2 protein [Rhodoluna sp.]|uniref:glycosyltransferase family 2 protein n=1 Tax=Rhodoluna sp. TaxID=1969481 RepID=UPI0025D7FAB5|nr:glycosyltransferase family 2 protein [Rhodoluna sp.]